MIPLKSRYQAQPANWGNYAIITLCVVVFLWEMGASKTAILAWCFVPKTFSGVLSSIFLHADLMHLLGNMLVLNVFGKAIVDKLGSMTYIALFLLMGVSANAFYAIFCTMPSLGASGAISGVLAMSLLLMPFVDIKVAFWVLPPITFDLASFWIAGTWFIFDVWHSSHALAGDRIAYQAHVGGFLSGVAISLFLIFTGRIAYTGTEKSLLEIFFGLKTPVAAQRSGTAAAQGSGSATFQRSGTAVFQRSGTAAVQRSGTAAVQRSEMPGRCCDNCGAVLAKDAARCEHCGISLTRVFRKG